MESKKNWAKLFLCILLFGSVEMNVAHAENHSEDIKKVETINQKEKINDLDLFIEKKIAEEVKKEGLETKKVKSDDLEKDKRKSVIENKEKIKKEEGKNERELAFKKIKQMEKVASYIAENYKISLDKAKSIVYAAFLESKKKNLEPMLVLSLISIESMFNQYSKSSSGAVGLTQVMAKVHKKKILANKIDVWSVRGNIQIGTDILREYVQLANGNVRKALQMYNGSSRDPRYRYSNKIMTKMQTFTTVAKTV